jgi:hypothetical protein
VRVRVCAADRTPAAEWRREWVGVCATALTRPLRHSPRHARAHAAHARMLYAHLGVSHTHVGSALVGFFSMEGSCLWGQSCVCVRLYSILKMLYLL